MEAKSVRLPWMSVASISEGVEALLGELHAWLDGAYWHHRDLPWKGGHDEGTFATAWIDYYRWSSDERVPDLLRTMRDKADDWGRANLVHGYHPEAEVHHGIEHALQFLIPLCDLFADDKSASMLLDVAHHVGNWAAGVPPWYDWNRHRFVRVAGRPPPRLCGRLGQRRLPRPRAQLRGRQRLGDPAVRRIAAVRRDRPGPTTEPASSGPTFPGPSVGSRASQGFRYPSTNFPTAIGSSQKIPIPPNIEHIDSRSSPMLR